jgi:beta-galactosidase
MKIVPLFFLLALAILGCKPSSLRTVNCLNGNWQLASSADLKVQPDFTDTVVPVPGLVDMAVPGTDSVHTSNRIYWYRKTFETSDKHFEICHLKINKAKYQTRVFINNQFVGENPYSFTPTEIDITNYLEPSGSTNEIIIAVGCRNNLPANVSDGNDFEKDFYYPGIYDDVKLIYAAKPFIQNVQCVPKLKEEKLHVKAEFLTSEQSKEFTASYAVYELASGNRVASGSVVVTACSAGFDIDMPGCSLWTPEDPFLYRLELKTPGDSYSTRFGMRSFRFDGEKKLALLNEKPYFLRGTNVCIYRFFDDPSRTDQPWQSDWTTRLHEQFKSMHWNSIRYCIGFPPERWYEIADSIGFLIADEFPLWYGNNPEIIDSLDREVTAIDLAGEYHDWMRERWNHPSVVIWDAQNESVTDITGEAIALVRELDLSGRPWENGWAAPQAETDPIESHPYLYPHFFANKFDPPPDRLLSYFYDTIRIPHNDANERSPANDGNYYENPVLINEYCWLWVNRDGSPTRLTKPIFENAFGTNLTSDEMFEIYARHLAIMTEYWRVHRLAAGVQHFCGLGYSRPDEPLGETSDNFSDINSLVYESNFEKYVKSSFSPVGLMLEVWDYTLNASTSYDRKIYLVNDLEEPWSGMINIYFESPHGRTKHESIEMAAGSFQRSIQTCTFTTPSEPGTYDMVAEIEYKGEDTRSVRQVSILPGNGFPLH